MATDFISYRSSTDLRSFRSRFSTHWAGIAKNGYYIHMHDWLGCFSVGLTDFLALMVITKLLENDPEAAKLSQKEAWPLIKPLYQEFAALHAIPLKAA